MPTLLNFIPVEQDIEKLTLDIFFIFNAGRIQGKYYAQKNKTSPSVIIVPPDPRYGGNLDNKIVEETANVFIKCGFSVLRINYRGIDKSEGTFTCKEDAIFDTSVAIDWLHEQNEESSHFWLVGYSFGAYVAGNVMMRRPEIETFVLISPLLNKYNFSFISPCLASGAIIIGENDDFTTIEDAEKLVTKMNESALFNTQLITIPDANHLYKNCIEKLCSELEVYINIKLATRVAKPVRKKRRRRKKKDSVF